MTAGPSDLVRIPQPPRDGDAHGDDLSYPPTLRCGIRFRTPRGEAPSRERGGASRTRTFALRSPSVARRYGQVRLIVVAEKSRKPKFGGTSPNSPFRLSVLPLICT